MPSNPRQYARELRAALLTMDETTIRALGRKWGVRMAPDADTFWTSMHKARCSMTTMPESARAESAAWLLERGMYPGVYRIAS